MERGRLTEGSLLPAVTRLASFVNLEPVGAGSFKVGATTSAAVSHVGQHWSSVVGPLLGSHQDRQRQSRNKKILNSRGRH